MRGRDQLKQLLRNRAFDLPCEIDGDRAGQILELQQRRGMVAPLETLRSGCGWRLSDVCPSGAACWGDLPAEAQRECGDMSIPWIGSRYETARICTLAINLRNEGGLLDEYKIVEDVASYFATGRPKAHRSWFRYRTLTGVALVRASLEDRDLPPVDPAPQDLILEFAHQAQVQLVKCSPSSDGTGLPNDSPTGTMFASCPSMHGVQELELLSPRVLMMFGDQAQSHASAALGGTWTVSGAATSFGVGAVGSQRVLGIALPHPSSRPSSRCLEGLARLREALETASLPELCDRRRTLG